LRTTGKERDTETNLDYFGARYFSGAQGRFTSPDKLNATDDRSLVPSSFNKYAYAANNPLRFADPDGRDVVALLEPPHGIMPGHFMLFADNPSNGQSAMMSFGPIDTSTGTRAIQVLGGPVGSTATFAWPTSADELRQNYAALSIQTSPEQAQDVINFINTFSTSLSTDHLYRLYNTNCTTVCRDALKAIGILPRNYESITPFGLWTSLYGRFSNPLMQRFSTTNLRHGEQSQLLRTDSRQGVDYGNPRFGMNTFDFIMLLLRPREEVKSKIYYTGADGTQVYP
jgi:RHS repeat-associated protein